MFAKIAVFATVVLVTWAVVARPLGAHGNKVSYRVQAHDTLWTIAATHYSGDAGNGVWQIEHANRLAGPAIRPGQVLVLP